MTNCGLTLSCCIYLPQPFIRNGCAPSTAWPGGIGSKGIGIPQYRKQQRNSNIYITILNISMNENGTIPCSASVLVNQ